MKRRLTKLSELQASLLIAGAFSLLFLIAGVIFLFFHKPGIIIGVGIGTVVEMFYIWLVNVSSSKTLREEKGGIFILMYFLRVAVLLGVFTLLVVLQYKLQTEAFKYSCWAMLITFAPSTFITIATQLMHKEERNG